MGSKEWKRWQKQRCRRREPEAGLTEAVLGSKGMRRGGEVAGERKAKVGETEVGEEAGEKGRQPGQCAPWVEPALWTEGLQVQHLTTNQSVSLTSMFPLPTHPLPVHSPQSQWKKVLGGFRKGGARGQHPVHLVSSRSTQPSAPSPPTASSPHGHDCEMRVLPRAVAKQRGAGTEDRGPQAFEAIVMTL